MSCYTEVRRTLNERGLNTFRKLAKENERRKILGLCLGDFRESLHLSCHTVTKTRLARF